MITKSRNEIVLITGFVIASLIFQPTAFGSSHMDAKINVPFTIEVGQTVEIKSEGLTIELVDIADSRCPTDVTCVWEGEITMILNIKKGGDKSKETSLEIKTSQSSKTSFDNYSIELSSVEPYPISTKEIKKEEYVATLVVKQQKNLSPLKQFKSGVSIEEIKCKESLILVQKNNGNPACIKPEHYEKLKLRGWAKTETSNSPQQDTEATILEIAEKFILTSPTFAYDGMRETLRVRLVSVMESFPEQYVIEVKFSSLHGGYGDRTDQIVTQVITPHTVSLIVSEGNVISAVTDEKWDELNHQYVLKKPNSEDDISMHVNPVHDYASFIESIEKLGFSVEFAEDLEDSSFGVPTKVVSINEEEIQVFEFTSATKAHDASLIVSGDGTQIGTSIIRWIDTPHFYTQDNLIVLYVGHTQEILDLLESLLDKQFAGM